MITCECGKFFEKYQSYAAHKSHCGKNNETWYKEKNKKFTEKGVKASKEKSAACKAKYELWLNEKRICEKCKIEFTLKEKKIFSGSGKFCSRSCANGRKLSDETKQKIRSKLKGKPTYKEPWNKNCIIKNSCNVFFFICKHCKNAHCSKYKNRKYCSGHCQSYGSISNPIKISQIRKNAYINGKKVGGGTTKWYEYTNIEGITFKVQGSYELRVCYLLDKWKSINKILNWEYTNDRIKYIGVDKEYHWYLLDFKVIESNEKFYYIETKGVKTEKDDLKWQAAREQNIDLRIWFLNDIIENENKGYGTA